MRPRPTTRPGAPRCPIGEPGSGASQRAPARPLSLSTAQAGARAGLRGAGRTARPARPDRGLGHEVCAIPIALMAALRSLPGQSIIQRRDGSLSVPAGRACLAAGRPGGDGGRIGRNAGGPNPARRHALPPASGGPGLGLRAAFRSWKSAMRAATPRSSAVSSVVLPSSARSRHARSRSVGGAPPSMTSRPASTRRNAARMQATMSHPDGGPQGGGRLRIERYGHRRAPGALPRGRAARAMPTSRAPGRARARRASATIGASRGRREPRCASSDACSASAA